MGNRTEKICGFWIETNIGKNGAPEETFISAKMNEEFYNKLLSFGKNVRFVLKRNKRKRSLSILKKQEKDNRPDYHLFAFGSNNIQEV